MKRLVLCCTAVAAVSGCGTISTELDPGGSPKYRGLRGTGTNIAKRFDASEMPTTKVMGQDDVDRMMRPVVSGRSAGVAQ